MKFLLFSLPVFFLSVISASAQPSVVYFDYDKYELKPASITVIDSLVKLFVAKGLPRQVYVSGHTDSIGGAGYNLALSEKRALAVTDALLEKLFGAKLNKPEIMLFPKGLSVPLAGNETPNGRQQNRRVEISYSPVTEVIAAKPQPDPVPENKPETLKEQINVTGEGGNIILKNLHFRGGLRHLMPASIPVLEELLGVMQANPSLEIAIEGHICCVSGPQDGPDMETGTHNLSVQRAKTVYDYLIQNGIDKKRLAYRGFGHQFPLTAERTEAEMQQNRRVEIKIVKK